MEPQAYHVEEILVESLILSEENVRQDPGDVTDLKESLNKEGVLEPLTARPRSDGSYEVYIGGRRLAAAKLLGLKTLPVKLGEASDCDAVIRSLAENLQRKDLTPEQRATAYLRLQQLDPQRFSTRGLAKVTGVSQPRIVQELHAYDVQLHLRPHGIEVISGLSPSRRAKAGGTSLPEYHATLLHKAINEAKDHLTDQQLADVYPGLARAIAPLKRSQAKQVLAQFRQSPTSPISETVAVALDEERLASNESVSTMESIVDHLPEETADEPGNSGFRKHDQQAITNSESMVPVDQVHSPDQARTEEISPPDPVNSQAPAGQRTERRKGCDDCGQEPDQLFGIKRWLQNRSETLRRQGYFCGLCLEKRGISPQLLEQMVPIDTLVTQGPGLPDSSSLSIHDDSDKDETLAVSH